MESIKGYLLVFDLDQTLVATNKQFARRATRKKGFYREIWQPYKKPEVNPELVEVLKEAGKLRVKGIVYGIFLLTNNSNRQFIKRVLKTLEKETGIQKLFDATLTAEKEEPRDTPRGYPKNYSSKSLRDIYRLLNRMEATADSEKRYASNDVLKKTFFFDDMPDHKLRKELFLAGVKGNYVTIDPPFMGMNETPYGKVLDQLHSVVPSLLPNPIQALKNITKRFFTRKQRRV